MLPFLTEMPQNVIKRTQVKHCFAPTHWSLSVSLLLSPMYMTREEFLGRKEE